MDYNMYCEQYRELCNGLIVLQEQRIDDLIEKCTTELHIEISKRKRLEQAVDLISTEAMSSNKKKKQKP